jgi:hypothetical protein
MTPIPSILDTATFEQLVLEAFSEINGIDYSKPILDTADYRHRVLFALQYIANNPSSGSTGATGATGLQGETGATGASADTSAFVQKSGDTMTGKLVAAADLAESKLNIGNAIGTPGPATIANGDLWISNQNKFAWRTNGNTITAAGLSQTNTFSQPQTIGSTSNAAPVATITNTGTREAAVFTAQGTSPAVRITQTGTGESFRVEDETTPDATAFVISNLGRVGIGVTPDNTVSLSLDTTGLKFGDGTIQTTAAFGVAGATGATGVSGTNGATGATGAAGNDGATGATGIQGSTGSTGATGTAGVDGATGATGIQGIQGATGIAGVDGATGATGVQGNVGSTGATGIGEAGATGVAGEQGATGIAGSDGATGATGLQGEAGSTGATGVSGDIGATGATGVAGLDGATGVAGATGATGVSGEAGATGLAGADGATGATGVSGATGASGADGTGTAYYGQVSRITNGTINVATAGTYQSTGLTATLDSKNFGISLGTTDTFAVRNTSGSAQLFKIYGSADIEAGNNTILGIKLALNGTPVDNTECNAPTGVGTTFAKLITNWMIELQPNDEVALFVTNKTTAGNVTLLRGRVVASTVGRQGEEGATGVTGATGDVGATGLTGATGPIAENAVVSDTTGITGASQITNIVSISQADYDDIVTPDPSTLYIVIP